ncbi:MAG: YqaJ viral recombinase family protein [Oscillospiraceae bacterium]|nr:YqaJ viral recombinase family protein [Oscillospiraceae bacterium]
MNANILIETEGLTNEQWLSYRKQGIGGSDVSSIIGINRWKSEYELWLEKTSPDITETECNEAMEWGTLLEPVIRNHFSEITGKPVIEVKAILQHPEYPFMLADLDGITTDNEGNPAVLEIKTASEYKRSEWENAVPAYYETQVQHYLFVTGLSTAYIAVLIGGNSFKLFEVKADAHIQEMLVTLESELWNKVQTLTAPDIDGSDTVKNMLDEKYKGGDNETLNMSEDDITFINQYLAACAEEDNAKAKKQYAANHIKEILGNHNKAVCKGHTVTWKSVSTERFDSKALKESDPDTYDKYTKVSVSRRLTIK